MYEIGGSIKLGNKDIVLPTTVLYQALVPLIITVTVFSSGSTPKGIVNVYGLPARSVRVLGMGSCVGGLLITVILND